MRDTPVSPETIEAAANAITEFLTVAFQPEFLRWEKEVNLAIAEMVWNHHAAGRPSAHPRPAGAPPVLRIAPHLRPLRERLAEVRRTRWPEADWLVLGLRARVVEGEIVFAFELCWDDLNYRQPCEMTWVQRVAGPCETN